MVVVSALGLAALRNETVTVNRVEQGPLRQSVVASGRVRTPERIALSPQLAGRVVAVEVREGDVVDAGQPLIRLDDREWKAAVDQASAAVTQAEARLRQLRELGLPVAEQALRQAEATALQARQQHRRVRELVARGFYSQAQLDEARRVQEVAESQVASARLQRDSQQPDGIEVALAQSALEQARAALVAAQTRLGYAILRAPSAGEAGDTVQPGAVLLTIAPAGDTELTVQIDEKNLGLLRLGQPALASADAYPGERFAAELAFIAPSVDALRGSVEVRLRVPEPPPYLRHEMTVSIDIEAARREQTLMIPASAVRETGGAQPWVMVVRDGRAERQPVRLGIRGAGRVEVLEGVAVGEALVPAAVDVAAGQAVRTRAAP